MLSATTSKPRPPPSWLALALAGLGACAARRTTRDAAPVTAARETTPPVAPASGTMVACMWGGTGPQVVTPDGRTQMYAIAVIELRVERRRLPPPVGVRSLDLLDASGAVVGQYLGPLAPPETLPVSALETHAVDALIALRGTPSTTLYATEPTTRIRVHARVAVDAHVPTRPTRCRVVLDGPDGPLVIERPLDGQWPSA